MTEISALRVARVRVRAYMRAHTCITSSHNKERVYNTRSFA